MTEQSELCAAIQELYRQRQDLHRAELRLTYQIQAVCRRFVRGDLTASRKLYTSLEGGASHPLTQQARLVTSALSSAREAIKAGRADVETALVHSAMNLPIWPRVRATRGLGALSVACLVGETGDLTNYGSHSKLWKRLGLAVIDGQAQRRVGGPEATRQGYSPSRRSLVWNIGSLMLRAQSPRGATHRQPAREPGRFRLGYDARKAYELANGLPKAHAHNRAKRYMEKKLVRNIWRAWREAC